MVWILARLPPSLGTNGSIDVSLLSIEDFALSVPHPEGPRRLVDNVNITVGETQVVGIAGESGSGKTLTALACLGFLPDGATTEGVVLLDGQDILSLRGDALRRVRGRTVAMIFQDPMTSLHPLLTIEVQLTEQLRVHNNVSRAAARARASELLSMVRIPDPVRALSAYPHHFSGGMRQRIAIASALACSPSLLIADEVTTALDVTVQAGILELLDQLRHDTGMAVLFITHDLAVMNVTADMLYVMYAGRVVESGRTRRLLDTPRHPYTKALIGSLPQSRRPGFPLTVIPGEAVTAGQRPSGCAFHPRCPVAVPVCSTRVPSLESGGADWWCACHLDHPASIAGAAPGTVIEVRS